MSGTRRIRWRSGGTTTAGAAAAAPTVIYLDDVGLADAVGSLAWTMGDDVGAKDSSTLQWSLGDTAGQKDAMSLGWTTGDDVGFRDGDMILNIGLGDSEGAKDAMSLAWTPVDDVGLKDGASITGQGTPQWQAEAHTGGNFTNFNLASPTGTRTGDLLVLFLWTNGGTTDTATIAPTDSGWTSIQTQTFVGTVERLLGNTYWRVANTSTDPAAWGFSRTAQGSCGAEIHRVTGFNTTTPVNTSAVATLAASALVTNPVGPAVTTTVANCLIFEWCLHYHAALSNTHTVASPYTERTDYETTVLATLTASTNDTGIQGTAGSTGTVTHTCTETVATDAIMQAVAIAPGAININL